MHLSSVPLSESVLANQDLFKRSTCILIKAPRGGVLGITTGEVEGDPVSMSRSICV